VVGALAPAAASSTPYLFADASQKVARGLGVGVVLPHADQARLAQLLRSYEATTRPWRLVEWGWLWLGRFHTYSIDHFANGVTPVEVSMAL